VLGAKFRFGRPNFSFNSQKQKNKTTTGKNAPDGRIRGSRVLVCVVFVFSFSAKNNEFRQALDMQIVYLVKL